MIHSLFGMLRNGIRIQYGEYEFDGPFWKSLHFGNCQIIWLMDTDMIRSPFGVLRNGIRILYGECEFDGPFWKTIHFGHSQIIWLMDCWYDSFSFWNVEKWNQNPIWGNSVWCSLLEVNNLVGGLSCCWVWWSIYDVCKLFNLGFANGILLLLEFLRWGRWVQLVSLLHLGCMQTTQPWVCQWYPPSFGVSKMCQMGWQDLDLVLPFLQIACDPVVN